MNCGLFCKPVNNKYYVSISSDNINFYLLNKNLSTCTCKAYKYCKKNIRTCKHLIFAGSDVQNPKSCFGYMYFRKQNKDNFPIINLHKKKCSCDDFISMKKCKHIEYFNEGYMLSMNKDNDKSI
jgi:hypothetical protein